MATFKGLVKTCEACSAPFRVPQSLARVRTCSRECGYRVRTVANKKEAVTLKCAHCTGLFTSVPCHADRRVYCSKQCMEASPAIAALRKTRFQGDGNPGWRGGVAVQAVSASGRPYRRAQPHIENEKAVRRNRGKRVATPAWADLSAIRAIYLEARRITEVTGQPHHVDHVVPLKSPLVCGLHIACNLQILPATANLIKGNRLTA
jgi:hypothetical protein